MTRSGDLSADEARRAALAARLARLKVAAWTVVAGAWLALWALVSGVVAGTTTAASLPAATGQEAQSIDLFGQGSTLGTTSDTPVLRSHGS
jgi:uncharacterized membrane protein YccF (DUF307 family)